MPLFIKCQVERKNFRKYETASHSQDTFQKWGKRFWKKGKHIKITLLKVQFHQDNVCAHKSVVAMTDVCDCGFELVDHPPYSPDLAPSYYFCSPVFIKNTWLQSSIGPMMR